MWTCTKCGENHEGTFDACWNCGTTREESEKLVLDGADEPSSVSAENDKPADEEVLRCLRCHRTLDFIGTRRYREWGGWDALGLFGELISNKERFDVYCCPKCGRAEFFVHGIGDELRPD